MIDEKLQSLLIERWRNGSCLGYTIEAMVNLDFPSEDIQDIVDEMIWLFSNVTLAEAERSYNDSSY